MSLYSFVGKDQPVRVSGLEEISQEVRAAVMEREIALASARSYLYVLRNAEQEQQNKHK